MKMFVAAGWRNGMKNSGGMRDRKTIFRILIYRDMKGSHLTFCIIFKRKCVFFPLLNSQRTRRITSIIGLG